VVNFFLDNIVGGGQGEYSSGRVGLIRLYDSILSGAEVADMARDPFADLSSTAVPEPASLSILGTGIASLCGYGWRRRRSAK
jgi:hypothetical protein